VKPFLTVDLWADVICPFCALGARQLELAIEATGLPVEIHRHAFELDPTTPRDLDMGVDELVSSKYNLPLEQAAAMHRDMEATALSLGLSWDMTKARVTNTFDAHRVLALAASQGLDGPMSQRLYEAYFGEGALISEHQVLASLANEVGLEGASEMLAGDALGDVVRGDEQQAHAYGLSGVPAFVIDEKYLVSGAQGVDALAQALQQAWAER
jgi:predicted DsbA family dithiol-disulfide isomerase